MKNFILAISVFTCVSMLFLLPVNKAAAQSEKEKLVEMDEITVTAEKFPTEERKSARFITVISAEELKKTGGNNLVDALRRKGGLSYKSYGTLGMSHGGMNSEVSIRGVKNGELVLMNGCPIQGVAGHGYDLNLIPVDQIERVEILRGAASTLYGADAMSGVINIITKKNVEKQSAKAYVEFGDFEYQNHGAGFTGPIFNLGVNYSHLKDMSKISQNFSKGYKYATDDSNKYAVNLNINPFENLFLDYLGSYNETTFKRIKDSGKLSKGTDQEQTKHFVDARYVNDFLRLKSFYSYNLMKRDEFTNPSKSEDKNKNYNYGFEGDYRLSLMDTEFIFGGDYIYRRADYNNKYGKHHRNDYSGFMQIKKEFFEQLILTMGAREQFIKGDSDASDYDKFLPSFGINYQPVKNVNLNFFANASKAFRAPTYNNLYYESSFMVGNPDLGPEEGWTYEGGVKFNNQFFSARIAGFFMDYSDKIEIDRSLDPMTYYNAGNYESSGVEWEATLFPFYKLTNFLQHISLNTAGYWADPKAEDTSGDEYQAGDKFNSSVGISYQTEKIMADLSCDIATSRQRGLDDYSTLNFYGKYKILKGYLTIGVDNICNEEIQTYGSLLSSASNKYVYYGMARLFKIGYEITF